MGLQCIFTEYYSMWVLLKTERKHVSTALLIVIELELIELRKFDVPLLRTSRREGINGNRVNELAGCRLQPHRDGGEYEVHIIKFINYDARNLTNSAHFAGSIQWIQSTLYHSLAVHKAPTQYPEEGRFSENTPLC